MNSILARLLLVSICLLLLSHPDSLQSQDQETAEELEPGRLNSDVRKQLVPGLWVEYFSRAGQLLDSGTLRVAALAAQPNEPWTPFAERGGRVRIAGFLKLKLKGQFRFSAVGQGELQLSINRVPILEHQGDLGAAVPAEVELVKGYNFFDLIYQPPADPMAQLRIEWESDEFRREPIPASYFLHSPQVNRSSVVTSEVDETHRRLHLGRELVLTHHCLKCHRATDVHPMLASRDTPDLKISAGRINRAWLENWLLDPHAMRNSVSMPRLLDPERDAQAVADLAAFVLSRASEEPAANPGGDPQRGSELFENVGCIGCHHFEEPHQQDDYERVSLYFMNAKYRPGALADFLADSRTHYQWSRMPKFRLSDAEVADLEAFIRSESPGQVKELSVTERNAQRGNKFFVDLGCAQCHPGIVDATETGSLSLPAWSALNPGSGCLADDPAAVTKVLPVPDYPLNATEKQAVNELLRNRKPKAFARWNTAYFARRQIHELRCTTCHDLDEQQATLPYIIEEEGVVGLPPNRVPMLTYAGEKLLTPWSRQLISGQLPYRVREHFRVQMPGFPVRGTSIADGLARMHGYGVGETGDWEPDPEKVDIGKKVVAMETGLSCNRCHAIGDRKPNAAFDAQSTNLIYAAERLRKDYYLRWMFDPLRIDKQTKMPRFSEDGETTSLKAVAGGDAALQFDALWHYLHTLPQK